MKLNKYVKTLSAVGIAAAMSVAAISTAQAQDREPAIARIIAPTQRLCNAPPCRRDQLPIRQLLRIQTPGGSELSRDC